MKKRKDVNQLACFYSNLFTSNQPIIFFNFSNLRYFSDAPFHVVETSFKIVVKMNKSGWRWLRSKCRERVYMHKQSAEYTFARIALKVSAKKVAVA